MLIDWFTVAAQTLNFLILVWLLKRFLYQPILNAIDAREQRIAKALANAKKIKCEAEQSRDEFNKKNADFEQHRSEQMTAVKNAADTEQQRLLALARKQSDAVTVKRQAAQAQEQQNLTSDLSHLTRNEVFAISRKTLADLANKSLESSMVEVFISRLNSLDENAKTILVEAIKNCDKVIITSAFELPEPERGALQNAINKTFSAAVPLQFDVSDTLVAGIELIASGQKLAWTIEGYLANLSQSVAELLTPKIETKNPVVVTT